MSEDAAPELGTPTSSLFTDASVVWQEQGSVEEGASLGDEEEGEEEEDEEDARYGGYAMLGDGDDVAAQDESEDEHGGYAPLGAGDDDDINNDDAQQAAAAVQGLEGLEVHAQMARIGVALYVSEEEQQRRRAEAMAAFDARYQEEVRVAAAVATNERFPPFSADHINDIKEAMRGISLPANAPAWAQPTTESSQPKKSQ